MLRYEILMLAVPEITGDEAQSLESKIEKVVEADKGTMLSFERWGKYRLAYPVAKNDYGVYFLARFEVEQIGSLLDELKILFAVKLNELVMRHMVTRLDMNDSLAYHRPQSLEDTPSRDVGAFLREQKVESLISSVDAKEHEDVQAPEADAVVKTTEVVTEGPEGETSEVVEQEVVSEEQA